MVWDKIANAPRVWNTDTVAYEKSEIQVALTGTYPLILADGKKIECKPVWQLIADNAKEWTPEKTAEITWLPADMIRETAIMYATLKPASTEWGVAMSQQTRCYATNQVIFHLWAMTGNLDVFGG